MEENKFVENFAFQFDETDPSDISIDTKFKELDEWSSLTALSIMAMADEQYSVRLTADDFKDSTTLGDIFELIKERA
jgi:acyl carrier protein